MSKPLSPARLSAIRALAASPLPCGRHQCDGLDRPATHTYEGSDDVWALLCSACARDLPSRPLPEGSTTEERIAIAELLAEVERAPPTLPHFAHQLAARCEVESAMASLSFGDPRGTWIVLVATSPDRVAAVERFIAGGLVGGEPDPVVAALRAEVARLATVEARWLAIVNGNREATMRDAAELVVREAERPTVPKIATWGPMRYVSGGTALRVNKRIVASRRPYRGRWLVFVGGMSPEFATEAEAVKCIQAHAKAKGWEVKP